MNIHVFDNFSLPPSIIYGSTDTTLLGAEYGYHIKNLPVDNSSSNMKACVLEEEIPYVTTSKSLTLSDFICNIDTALQNGPAREFIQSGIRKSKPMKYLGKYIPEEQISENDILFDEIPETPTLPVGKKFSNMRYLGKYQPEEQITEKDILYNFPQNNKDNPES